MFKSIWLSVIAVSLISIILTLVRLQIIYVDDGLETLIIIPAVTTLSVADGLLRFYKKLKNNCP